MKNEQLSEMINDVSSARISLVSCVTDEQRSEWMRLYTKANDLTLVLSSLKVTKRNSTLIEKAWRVLKVAREVIEQYRAAFRQADSCFSQMAFAAEWR